MIQLLIKKLKIKRIVNFTIQNTKPNKKLIAKEKEEKRNLFGSIFSFIILLILFGFSYFLLIILISKTYQRYRYYIITAWLIPSFTSTFLDSLFSSFLFNLIFTFFVFKIKNLKTASGIKRFFFKYLLSSEIYILFKLRKLVIKYQKELNHVFSNNLNKDELNNQKF
jgi:hypothetical protein